MFAMTHFFFNDYFIPFHLSVIALIVLSLAESIGIYLGTRPSTFILELAPKWLIQSPLFNVKFSKVLILVFLLINFSFAGYFLQLISFAKQQAFISPYLLILPAFIIAIFFTVFMIHCLDQVIKPLYQRQNSNLLGRLATISSGNARPGFSAQARVRDEFGQIHYVQVEPEFGELEFRSQVILIGSKQTHYIAKKIATSNHLFAPE